MPTQAEKIKAGDGAAIETVAGGIIRLRSDNLIERPWGGTGLCAFKGLPVERATAARRYGESFEISAYPDDAEAAANPSVLLLADGSEMLLTELLAEAPILGDTMASRFKSALPLLPKFLDVQSLLSVQAHPPGHPECYIILAADEGATIRIGFKKDVDRREIVQRCRRGRQAQERLLDLLGSSVDQQHLQTVLAPLFASAWVNKSALADAVRSLDIDSHTEDEVVAVLSSLRSSYWSILESLNEIPVSAGQVVFNATPDRLRKDGQYNAEVHALGNPAELGILMLEIRKPGPTFRAWDHVRFPIREIDIDAAIDAMNLSATTADEFLASTIPASSSGEASRLLSCDDFDIDHIRVESGVSVNGQTLDLPVTVHGIGGQLEIADYAGRSLGTIECGESALLPARLGHYQIRTQAGAGEAIAVRVYP